MAEPCWIGVDLGTSGCRAVAINRNRRVLANARTAIPDPQRDGSGGVEQDPELWWQAVVRVLRELAANLGDSLPFALCVDGTSSTVLMCSADGAPLAPALMYNDARSRHEAERIAAVAPATSPAQGATSSLAKLLHLQAQAHPPAGSLALHQSDWIAGRLTGRFGTSDWNNGLKLGYEPLQECWPDWIAGLVGSSIGLPRIVRPGTPVGNLSAEATLATGLPASTRVLAGTTDSTAAFIAAGAGAPGEAVTSLGSTLVVKILARAPVTAPEHGVYSHRFGDLWLVGGASNTGGSVLRQLFGDDQIHDLTARLRPDEPTGLDYYPLPGPGERFPVMDPDLQPRLAPRPSDEAVFFQAILEGIARIEASAYRRLENLGAPPPKTVITVGGGADNPGWTRIRTRLLGVPVVSAAVREAAFGTALLALSGQVPS